jgi:hypothetical protein
MRFYGFDYTFYATSHRHFVHARNKRGPRMTSGIHVFSRFKSQR